MTIDLRTHYLGLPLRSPIAVSSCPLTEWPDRVQRLEAAGAAAVVMPSLFEEQIEHDEVEIHRLHQAGREGFAEAATYFPDLDDYNTGADGYLRRIEDLKRAVTIPVIASLNGVSAGGWVGHAARVQDAGADALELNVYYLAADAARSGSDVEQSYVDLVAAVKSRISIPLAVKLSPYFSSLPHLAGRLVDAGADGLVLFNRFLQPDIDLETLSVTPHLALSTSEELRLPLRWIAILRGRLRASLAATGGVHTAADVLKVLLAGADAAMTASSLLRHGPDHLRVLLAGVEAWMRDKGYRSVGQLIGSMSQLHCPDPTAFERANYMQTLMSFTARDPGPR